MTRAKHKPAHDPLAGQRCICGHLYRHHGHWLNSTERFRDIECLRCWHCLCEQPVPGLT